jgi:CHRD domain-containing protein
MRRSLRLTLGAFVLLGLSAAAQAQQKTWCITATGSEQVPPVNSTAVAEAVFTLDPSLSLLSWNITHSGLSGALTATHIHGPAAIGANGGIQLSLGTGNPVVGSAFLTGVQLVMLNSGQMYLNLHSDGFPSGEVRGQIDDVCVTTLCSGLANSFTAAGARLSTPGDFVAANNAVTFLATGVPPSQFGYLLIGQGTGVVTPPGSAGQLCLSGAPIGRFNGQIGIADGAGVMGPFTPDIANLPSPPGGAVSAGQTWGFQTWYRDVGGTSNFSDALSVTFE